ncbi:MAG TPA: hypothetical protein VFT22_18975 [Kofleriaceae bacterium]|nr:hypothetical protein [Kofleriaceae bacterium]
MRTGALVVLALAACADPGQGGGISTQVRHDRLALIRDTAAEMGVYNAALIGGIAVSETRLAHCWSEATYACKGPDSPSCDGPIIAGSADGPCAAMQGGLGMFQFDAGTWSDTLATYGDAILTEAGNTAQAVSFVLDQVMLDVPDRASWIAAADWMNQIPLVAGEPVTEQWARLVACRYNGCCASSELCAGRAAGYRDHAIELVDELGAEFWRTSDRCAALPGNGVIDQRTACYLAGGDPRVWNREPGGYGGTREWALTRAGGQAGAPASFARWIVRTGRAGRYRIEVFADGGEAVGTYEVVHAGQRDTVSLDQAAARGFAVLGEFELAGEGDEHIELATAADAAGGKLVFDAVRVTALDGAAAGDGGCAAGRAGGGGAGLIGLVALASAWAAASRPRRRLSDTRGKMRG